MGGYFRLIELGEVGEGVIGLDLLQPKAGEAIEHLCEFGDHI